MDKYVFKKYENANINALQKLYWGYKSCKKFK